jgi:hypothetical protein
VNRGIGGAGVTDRIGLGSMRYRSQGNRNAHENSKLGGRDADLVHGSISFSRSKSKRTAHAGEDANFGTKCFARVDNHITLSLSFHQINSRNSFAGATAGRLI